MKTHLTVFWLSFLLVACSTPKYSFQQQSLERPHATLKIEMVDNGLFRIDEPIVLVRTINGLSVNDRAEAWKLHAYSEFLIPVGDIFIEIVKSGDYGYIRFPAIAGNTYILSYQDALRHRFMLSIRDSQQHLVVSRTFEKRIYPDYAKHEKEKLLVDAIAADDINAVQRLLQVGADPNWKDPYGPNPIQLAALENNLEVLRLLVERGGKININRGQALRLAAKNGNMEMVKYLLEEGADINLRWHKRNSAIMEAAKHGHIKIVKLLLQSRAYTKLRNEDGKIAMELAEDSGFQEIVYMLKEESRK